MAQGKKHATEEARREAIRESNRRYREAHRYRSNPTVLEKKREYYQSNREVILAKARKYYADNRDRIQAWRNSPEVRAARLQYMAEYRAGHAGEPLPLYWPYGHTDWPLDVVNTVVPRAYPEDIRADICQELCLLIIEGETESTLVTHLPYARSKAYGNTFRYRLEDAMALGWDQPYDVYI